jgi:hypothetical protein
MVIDTSAIFAAITDRHTNAASKIVLNVTLGLVPRVHVFA